MMCEAVRLAFENKVDRTSSILMTIGENNLDEEEYIQHLNNLHRNIKSCAKAPFFTFFTHHASSEGVLAMAKSLKLAFWHDSNNYRKMHEKPMKREKWIRKERQKAIERMRREKCI